MDIGMSLACFYPMEPEKTIDEAKSAGIKVCEVFLNTYSELEFAYLENLRERCDKAGIRVHSVHPFTSALEHYMFFSPYPRRIADSVAFYSRYADAAKILGASAVNIHGDRGLGLDRLDDYIQCIAPLLNLQNKTGIKFSFENVYYNSVNHPEFVEALKRKVSDVYFTFDIKQACKGGQDPYILAKSMGSSIANFHVNDCSSKEICLLPGRGEIDYDRMCRILREADYKGPALIEVYRGNFAETKDILESKKYLEEKFCLQCIE